LVLLSFTVVNNRFINRVFHDQSLSKDKALDLMEDLTTKIENKYIYLLPALSVLIS